MEQVENRMKKVMKLILFTFFILLMLVALHFSISVFLFSLIGVGLGVLVAPVLSLFKNKLSMPRGLSALVFFLLGILFLGGMLYGTWYLVSDQITGLSERAPQIAKNLNAKFSTFLDRSPWIKEQLDGVNIAGTAKEVAERFFKGLRLGLETMAGLAFAAVLGLYAAISLPEYFKSTVRMFPASHRERAKGILHQCANTLRSWFRAQATDMAILGAITSLALWAIGVEFWAVYGLMTAMFAIVPYVGIFFVVITATLITLASDPTMAVWVLVVFIVTQQIEANVILPLIMRSQVHLPEVPLLIFILFLGAWFGLLGVFLAPPLFAILRVLYLELYLPKMNRS